jgi:hypothetical protein
MTWPVRRLTMLWVTACTRANVANMFRSRPVGALALLAWDVATATLVQFERHGRYSKFKRREAPLRQADPFRHRRTCAQRWPTWQRL